MNQRNCGNCKHYKQLRGGSNPLACCQDRTVIEYWGDKALTVRLEVWPERDATTCAVFAA
jgi:hypothetical protein